MIGLLTYCLISIFLVQDPNVKPVAVPRRQIFVIRILGLYGEDTPTSVHIEKSDTTVREVIQAALVSAGKVNENPDDFVLLEETVTSHCSLSPVGPSFKYNYGINNLY